MNGDDVFSFTISDVPRTIKEFLSFTQTDVNDYDSVVLHQANLFICNQLARKFKLNKEKNLLRPFWQYISRSSAVDNL